MLLKVENQTDKQRTDIAEFKTEVPKRPTVKLLLFYAYLVRNSKKIYT